MPMYDLNILWTPSTTREELDRRLLWAGELGYDVVALNHIMHKIPDGQIVNPLPKITGPLSQSASAANASKPKTTATVATTTPTPPVPFPKTILHRLTLHTSDPSTHHRLPHLLAAYDIIAIRPTTEKAFLSACSSSSSYFPEASIISLDFTQRLNYHIKHKNAMTAVKRGVVFEICYSHMLWTPHGLEADDDTTARCWAKWEQLFAATRGRGVILSSEAGRKLALRSPASMRNFMALRGLSEDKGMAAQTETPRLVLRNQSLLRGSYKGVVEIVRTAERARGEHEGERDVEMVDTGAENGGKENGKGKGKGKGKKKVERKDDGKDGDGDGDGREGSSDVAAASKKRKAVELPGSGAQATPPASKRQAKKMRKALREAQEGKKT